MRLSMFKLLKLFVDFQESLNVFRKDEELLALDDSSEEDDQLSDVANVALHAVDQRRVF